MLFVSAQGDVRVYLVVYQLTQKYFLESKNTAVIRMQLRIDLGRRLWLRFV